jgi:hypothetical protein
MGDRSQERNLARTERRQVRLAEAYIGLLEMVEQIGLWAQSVRPVLDSDPPREPPPLPDLEIQRAVYARVNAYGSQHIKKLMMAWQRSVADVRRADWLVGMRQDAARRHGGAPVTGSTEFMDDLTPWMELEDRFRPAEQKARELNMQVDGLLARFDYFRYFEKSFGRLSAAAAFS